MPPSRPLIGQWTEIVKWVIWLIMAAPHGNFPSDITHNDSYQGMTCDMGLVTGQELGKQ